MCTFLLVVSRSRFLFFSRSSTQRQVEMFTETSGGKRQKGKKGKFNFRNPKFLFYDYTEFVVGGVSVCAGASVEGSVKELAHS